MMVYSGQSANGNKTFPVVHWLFMVFEQTYDSEFIILVMSFKAYLVFFHAFLFIFCSGFARDFTCENSHRF